MLARVIAVASAAGAALPADLAHDLAVAGGTLEWLLRPGKRAILRENLAHAAGRSPADPAIGRLVRREVVNEARRSADLLWAIARPHELLGSVRVEGLHAALEVAARGGMIVAGPHLGGWEVVGPAPATILGRPVGVVVSDDWLAWAVHDIRRRVGLISIYASSPPRTAVDHLQAGRAVLMFADMTPDGVRTMDVPFLDGVAALPAGPAVLARLAQVPIVPLAVLPIDRRAWLIRLGDPIPPPPRRAGEAAERRALEAMAAAWTAEIRRNPQQWAAVYPLRWRSPDGAKSGG